MHTTIQDFYRQLRQDPDQITAEALRLLAVKFELNDCGPPDLSVDAPQAWLVAAGHELSHNGFPLAPAIQSAQNEILKLRERLRQHGVDAADVAMDATRRDYRPRAQREGDVFHFSQQVFDQPIR